MKGINKDSSLPYLIFPFMDILLEAWWFLSSQSISSIAYSELEF